jgi:hypothetical protein
MELALTAIIIAAIVLLLQIISLAQIAGIRRSMRMQREIRPQQIQHGGDRFDKKNQEFRRQERRPFPEQRPPQPAVAQIDPAEKSLRDLNLRLKSAEREQESARRKMQEHFPRGDHFRGRDDRGRGGGRDRDRNNRRDRDGRRDNWQERNRQGGFQQHQSRPQQRSEPSVEKKAADLPAPEIRTPARQDGPAAAREPGNADFAAGETLEHGRKIIVKRRILRENAAAESGAESTSVKEAPSSAPQTGAVPADQTSSPSSFTAVSVPIEHREEETKIGEMGPAANPEGDIMFGRRRQ